MKISYVWVLVAFFAVTSYAQAVGKGDTKASVLAELGNPIESVKSGDYEMLTFERGKVELLQGLVVSSDLISTKELEARKLAQKKSAKVQGVANKPSGTEKDGIAAKSRLLNSDEYQAMTVSKKVEALKSFNQKHPGVNLTDVLLPLLKELEQNQKEAAKDAKIALLEQQVKDAKLQSVRAYWREQEAREDAENDILEHYQMIYPPIYLQRRGYFSIGHDSPGSHFSHPRHISVHP